MTAVSSGKSVITVTDGGEFSASFVIYVPDIMVGEPEITGFSADETMTCIVPVSGTETSKVAMLVSVYKEGVLVDFKCIEKTELTENDEIELSIKNIQKPCRSNERQGFCIDITIICSIMKTELFFYKP